MSELRAYDPLRYDDRSLDRPSGFYEPAQDPLDFISKLMTSIDAGPPGVSLSTVDTDAIRLALLTFLQRFKGAGANVRDFREFDLLQEVLPRSAKWLNKQLRSVGGDSPVPLTRLGSGAEVVAFDLGNTGDVLKVFPYGISDYAQRTLTFPPPQLLPVRKWAAKERPNKIGYAVQEKGTPFKAGSQYLLGPDDWKRYREVANELGSGLAKYGYKLADPNPANLGFSRAGEPAVLDIGALWDTGAPFQFVPFFK